MTLERTELASIAARYAEGMTSIRGRRVQRLVLRELAGYEIVLPAAPAVGGPALLAVSREHGVAVCQTDGTGPSAPLHRCGLAGWRVTAQHDLLKDSLPVLGWSLWHPALADVLGTLTVSAAGLDTAALDAAQSLFSALVAPR